MVSRVLSVDALWRWLAVLAFVLLQSLSGRAVAPRRGHAQPLQLNNTSLPATVLDGGQKQQQSAALISSGRNALRLCNNRPQRLLPTLGSKQGKSSGKSAVACRHYQKPFNPLYSGRAALTAPIRHSASCDYYIIALRHIIR